MVWSHLLRDRRLVRGLAIVPSAAILLFIAWNVLANYRPALKPGEVYGIDVSAHQKPLDWAKVARDDIAFAYIKATEGSSSQDEHFDSHWQGARRAGLKPGAYHYFSLCSAGKTQAENFLKTVPDEAEMLPPVLDLEFSPFCKNQPSKAELIAEVDDFLALVKDKTNQEVMLYVGDDFDQTYQVQGHYQDHKFWQLRYLRRPNTPHHLWQVGGFFQVNGAPGKVDLNVGRIEDL
jgi:lysozyme